MAEGDQLSAEAEKAFTELASLDAEFKAADREVERYQHKLHKPLYEKRTKLIANIPQFWATALGNHGVFGPMITYSDAQILSHLDDFSIDSEDDAPWNYKVIMTFKPNPFIKNAKLVKEYKADDNSVVTTTQVTIDWHEGKGPAEEKNRDDDELSFFAQVVEKDQPSFGELIKDFYAESVKYYHGEEDEDEDGEEEFDLGEEDSEEEEDEIEQPAQKRSKKK